MKYVQLGDRQASAIGLGLWQFGSTGWGWGRDLEVDEARRIVHRALELGINLFDTAEMYGGGRSEEILGEALSGRRDEALIATKVSPHHLTRKGIREAAQRSLRRLRTDRIDLYQVHWPNPAIPLSWTMRGMRDLVDSGLVAQVGVSNFGLGRWQRSEDALGSTVISNQVQYHLLNRKSLYQLLPYAGQRGCVVIAYSPLAQGALTGKYAQGNAPGGIRARNIFFSTENIKRLEPLMQALRRVATAHEATPSQVALAWLIHQPEVIAIPGAKSVEQVESNAAAVDIVLSDSEWESLRVEAEGFRRASLVGSLPNMISRLVRG